MKKNGRYTALEFLKEAGVKNPEELFGKVRINIGGLTVTSPDYVFDIPESAENEMDFVIGVENYTVKLEKGDKEPVISEGVEAAQSPEMEKVTADFEAKQKAKKEEKQ